MQHKKDPTVNTAEHAHNTINASITVAAWLYKYEPIIARVVAVILFLAALVAIAYSAGFLIGVGLGIGLAVTSAKVLTGLGILTSSVGVASASAVSCFYPRWFSNLFKPEAENLNIQQELGLPLEADLLGARG